MMIGTANVVSSIQQWSSAFDRAFRVWGPAPFQAEAEGALPAIVVQCGTVCAGHIMQMQGAAHPVFGRQG